VDKVVEEFEDLHAFSNVQRLQFRQQLIQDLLC
jgi:hypothetical protein